LDFLDFDDPDLTVKGFCSIDSSSFSSSSSYVLDAEISSKSSLVSDISSLN
jgi:hypothetical protein